MQKQVTLNPGESQRVSFLVSPTAEGDYNAVVDGLSGQFSAYAGVPSDILLHDVLITTNYDPPTGADDYIHARITNNGPVTLVGEITARRWESWMDEYDDASRRRQTIIVNPGETIEYHERIHGNDYTKYSCLWWLTGDWAIEPLTPMIPVQSGYHLGTGDPKAEAYALEVGSDHVVIRYAQYGVCNKWECRVYTPPVSPFEQRLRGLWYTDPAYCAFWFIPGLLPGKLYEAHCSGGTTSNREDRTQFTTP